MLLNRKAIAVADNGHSIQLYGYDVTKLVSDSYVQVAARFEAGAESLNLNKPFFDNIRDAFRKAMEFCVNEVVESGDKNKLKEMIRDQFVEFKPELLHKIKQTINAESATIQFDRATERLMRLEPELANFHASKKINEKVGDYCTEQSFLSNEQENEVELK